MIFQVVSGAKGNVSSTGRLSDLAMHAGPTRVISTTSRTTPGRDSGRAFGGNILSLQLTDATVRCRARPGCVRMIRASRPFCEGMQPNLIAGRFERDQIRTRYALRLFPFSHGCVTLRAASEALGPGRGVVFETG